MQNDQVILESMPKVQFLPFCLLLYIFFYHLPPSQQNNAFREHSKASDFAFEKQID